MYQIHYNYLRPKKADWLGQMYQSPFEERKNLSVWYGEHATILPLRRTVGEGLLFGRGGVIDNQGKYVELSGIPNRIGKRYDFSDSLPYHDEKVVYCGYLVNHWGHFLVEAVTRLWYFLKNDPTIDKYVFFLQEGEEREIKGNFLEFLRLLNVWDKIEIINTPTTYREVLVPEIAFQCSTFYSDEYLKIFDTVAENITIDPAWKPADKIYFTRSLLARTKGFEFGTECLNNFFQRNGFLVLAPETISLSQMIYYIRNASEIATLSGSVHHNILFARNGQKLIILERFVWNVDYQVDINRMRQLDVTPIDANFPIYSVDMVGPIIMGCNHILDRYIADKGMVPPDEIYRSKKYRDKCFKGYMASYQDNYRYRWHMEFFYPVIADSLYEAYLDSYPYFKEYLDGNRPFLREHYFQIHYWKQFLKRLIRYHQ